MKCVFEYEPPGQTERCVCTACKIEHFSAFPAHLRGRKCDPNREVKKAAVQKRRDARKPPICIHRGQPTGEKAMLDTCCAGEIPIELYACAVHGDCTERHKVEGHACCWGCKDYLATFATPVASAVLAQVPTS